jgi:hypothetical protein
VRIAQMRLPGAVIGTGDLCRREPPPLAYVRWLKYQSQVLGSTAVASISTFARSSTSPET